MERIDRGGAELARLTHDSLVGSHPTPGRPRVLIFAVGAVLIEMKVEAAPARRLHGRVTPAAEVDVEIHVGEIGADALVVASGRSDAAGGFELPLPAERSLVSLHCELPDGVAVETARVRL